MFSPLSASPNTFQLDGRTLVLPGRIHDQIHEYEIIDHKLFYRFFLHTKEWKELTLPENREALEVKADDEDLLVLDTQRVVHLTKSVHGEKSLLEAPNWWKGIFNLPIISSIYNRIVAQPKLELPEGALWSCSFLEEGTLYLDGTGRTHMLGRGHRDITPTDTVYIANKDSRLFFYYDPYIPKESSDRGCLTIPFPETSSSTFDLVHFVSARSGLFLIGYDITHKKEGEVTKTLALYFASVDANLLGMNALEVRYSYSSNSHNFRLPAVRYEQQPIPSDSISSNIGIERDIDNSMRNLILTVEGKQVEIPGIFTKTVNEKKWKFTPQSTETLQVLELKEIEEKRSFTTSVYDYEGNSMCGNHDARLKNFGDNSWHSPITIKTEGRKIYHCDLYRKQSQWNLVGFNCTDYTLVANPETQDLLQIEEVTEVSIDLSPQSLEIKHGNKTLFTLHRSVYW
jgi:hypothetical protein